MKRPRYFRCGNRRAVVDGNDVTLFVRDMRHTSGWRQVEHGWAASAKHARRIARLFVEEARS